MSTRENIRLIARTPLKQLSLILSNIWRLEATYVTCLNVTGKMLTLI